MLKYIKEHDSILLALVTALCYLATYFYERSVAIFFNYSIDFISLTQSSIITTIISLLVSLFIIVNFSTILIDLALKKNIKNIYIFNLIGSSPLLAFMLFIRYLNGETELLTIGKTIGFYILITLLYTHSKPNKTDKNDGKPQQNLTSKIHSISGDLFWAAILSLILVSSCGTYVSRTTSTFDGFQYENARYAIVKIYGDNIMAKKIVNGIFSTEAYVFQSSDLTKLKIEKVKLGVKQK